MHTARIVCIKPCKLGGHQFAPGDVFAIVACGEESDRATLINRLGWSAFRVEPYEGHADLAGLAKEKMLADLARSNDRLQASAAAADKAQRQASLLWEALDHVSQTFGIALTELDIAELDPDQPEALALRIDPRQALAAVIEQADEQLLAELPHIGPQNQEALRVWAAAVLDEAEEDNEEPPAETGDEPEAPTPAGAPNPEEPVVVTEDSPSPPPAAEPDGPPPLS